MYENARLRAYYERTGFEIVGEPSGLFPRQTGASEYPRREGVAMSFEPGPAHLSNHHRNTLTQIFQHPVSHNIAWRAVLSLLHAVAFVTESHEGTYVVSLGPETENFEFSGDKDIDTQQVVDLRRMLRNAGYGPEVEGATAER